MARERTSRRFDKTNVPAFRNLRDGCLSMAALKAKLEADVAATLRL